MTNIKKKVFLILGIGVALVALLLGGLYLWISKEDKSQENKNTVSGDFVFFSTEDFVYGNIFQLALDIDATYLLYLDSAMPAEEFKSQLQILQLEVFEAKEIYDSFIASNVIEDGTTSYYSERGFVAIDRMLEGFNALLLESDSAILGSNPQETIAYIYSAYQSEYEDCTLEYTTAMSFIAEAFTAEAETEE